MDAMTDKDVSDAAGSQSVPPAVLLKGGTLGQAMRRLGYVLQPGDLIFIDRRGWLYRHVAKATGSWTSQVGLCLRDGDGNWVVYEGGVPLVRRVELAVFLSRTRGNRFAVRRLTPPPTAEQLDKLAQAADRRVGRFNGMGFNYDSRQLFGPKLIREVFDEVLGRSLGQVSTLADLRPTLPASTLWFWRLWYLGAIPWQRRTCTPHSLYVDPGLHTVFESF